MIFDVFKWEEINATESHHESPKGRLLLRMSQSGAVYVSAQGYEVLAGVGTEIDVTTAEDVTFRIEAPKNTRAFLYRPAAIHTRPMGEKFTNQDRRPEESGTVLEVKRALRELQLAQRAALREIRQAQAEGRKPVDAPDKVKPKDEPPAPETDEDGVPVADDAAE